MALESNSIRRYRREDRAFDRDLAQRVEFARNENIMWKQRRAKRIAAIQARRSLPKTVTIAREIIIDTA